MKKKFIGVCICMLLIMTEVPLSLYAGNPEDPEITDPAGDAFGYIDIDSVWFFEQEDTPEYLYVSMKINEPSQFKFQQTFATFWEYKDVPCACATSYGVQCD